MRLLTVQEVSEILRVPRSRAYELARQGLIPSVRLGRQVRIEESALHEWIGAGGRGLPGGWRRGRPHEKGRPQGEDL